MPRYRFEQIAINSTDKKQPIEADKHTYLGLEHLDSDCLDVTRYGADVAPIGEKLIMKKGDVLFGKRRAYQRKVAIAPFDGIFSAHGMVLRPRTEVIRPDLFPFFISSNQFLNSAIQISVGSLSPTINWRDLKDLEFDIPEINDQTEFARLLWSTEEARKAYRRLIFASEQLVKSRFIEMFGSLPTNEKQWEIATVRDVTTEVRYGSSRPAVDGGRYPYLRMNNITYSGELDLSDIKQIDIPGNELQKCTVRRGDVLFNRTNSKELVGKTCVYNRDEMMVLAGFVIRVRVNEKMLPEFLSAFLNTDFSKQMLLGMCKAAIGQANINAQELQNIELYVPPITMQKNFVAFKQHVDKSKFEIQQSLEKQKPLKKR